MRLKKYIKNPYLLAPYLGSRGLLNWMKDETFLQLRYRAMMDRTPDLKNPRTYTEKIQWLKLHDRRPEYPPLADKSLVKEFVKNTIGEEYLIPTLAVWDKAEDIDFDILPDAFVLKCTHDSGGMLICRDKSRLDREQAIARMDTLLRKSFFSINREWVYKNITPRIIAEPYMEDSRTGELRDYKFFCFDGVPKLMFVASERQKPDTDTKFDFFDMDYNHLDLINGHPNAAVPPERPENFERMKILAANLSRNIPHVRVDFYEVDGKVYFGELTFYHFSGSVPFQPESWDETIGSWLTLPPMYHG